MIGAVPAARPDRIAAVAWLCGLDAAPASRVLQIGCGAGGHLIPLAVACPHGVFVGVEGDDAARAEALRAASELGLDNLRVVSRLDDVDGDFDLVIARGGALDGIAERLSDRGLAVLGFRAVPGARVDDAWGFALRRQAATVSGDAARVGQARAMSSFLASGVGDSAWGEFVRQADAGLRRRTDDEVLALLAEPSPAHRLVDVVARAEARGLRYLADADVPIAVSSLIPPDLDAAIDRWTSDRVVREQYVDFAVGRSHRLAVLSGREASEPDPARVADLFASTAVRREGGRLVRPDGREVRDGGPLLDALVDAAPADVPLGSVDPEALLALVGRGLADLSRRPAPVCATPPERPRAPRWARWQAASGSPVLVNLRHAPVPCDPLVRTLVAHLDGTRDADALGDVLRDAVSTGALTVRGAGGRALPAADAASVVGDVLPVALAALADLALIEDPAG